MNGQLSASDVLAITKNNDGFGGVGLIILLFIFLIGIGGNGFVGGNSTAYGLADIQASLYNQTQDANSRQIQNSIATVNDTVLNNKYDNAVLIKDLSTQMSNSVAGISNLIANQTATMTNLFNQQTIDNLRDKLDTTRNELSNVRQTAQITENILSNLSVTAPKPPCFYGCYRTQSL